jgi:hypothetical protein
MEEEKKYLNNDQVERESWELIGVNVFLKNPEKGRVEMRFAYMPDIEDEFRIKDKEVILTKHVPIYIKRQVVSLIKQVLPGAKVKKKQVQREAPIPITISRKFKRKINE